MRYLDFLWALAVNVDTKTASLNTSRTSAVTNLTPENISIYLLYHSSPSEGEYEYIMGRVRELMEEGRGETIMELGQGEDTEGITDEEMAASVATLK